MYSVSVHNDLLNRFRVAVIKKTILDENIFDKICKEYHFAGLYHYLRSNLLYLLCYNLLANHLEDWYGNQTLVVS